MDFMGYTYDDAKTKRKNRKPQYEYAPLYMRLIFAFLSLLLPGVGQAIQNKHLQAFNFVLLTGVSLLVSRIFLIQTHLGIFTPILMAIVLVTPSIISAISAFRCKNHPGDMDTIVRNFFLYTFFYIIAIVPFHILNRTFGYKVYLMAKSDIHMKPLILPGDATVIHRGAYGLKTIGSLPSDSVRIGDFVYHQPVHEEIGGDNFPMHMILAVPGDTIRATDGHVMVNSSSLIMDKKVSYSGPANFGPVVVPKTQVFLVDNRGIFFPFYIKNIQGKAVSILWSKSTNGRFRRDRFALSTEHFTSPFENFERDSSAVFDSTSSVSSQSEIDSIPLNAEPR